MEICYGITLLEHNDPYISIAEEALEGVAEAGVLGTFWFPH